MVEGAVSVTLKRMLLQEGRMRCEERNSGSVPQYSRCPRTRRSAGNPLAGRAWSCNPGL